MFSESCFVLPYAANGKITSSSVGYSMTVVSFSVGFGINFAVCVAIQSIQVPSGNCPRPFMNRDCSSTIPDKRTVPPSEFALYVMVTFVPETETFTPVLDESAFTKNDFSLVCSPSTFNVRDLKSMAEAEVKVKL